MAPCLILTGFMATGKSTVAGLLARRLGWELVDCDSIVAERAGKPIAEIFTGDGEARFRELEHEVIAELAARRVRCAQCGRPRPAVISTGGGALLDACNAAHLHALGAVACLEARPEVIVRRLGGEASGRPKLAEGSGGLVEKVARLLEARRPAYARVSFAVDTSDLDVEQAADAVLEAFAAWKRERCGTSR